ncbi:hypothetical protein [Microbacterium sp. A84]|uniref:hypothetical protein n=1 Tax=Microbacterium sp. A84 TaxID=3450715 RepID=UPI003F4307DF
MSERPKEGIYLDAALGVIGEQVAERIDEIDRRRRRRTRVGVSVLAAVTVLSGSLAAAAMTGAFESPESEADRGPGSMSEPAHLRCVEDADAGPTAFFTANYRLAAGATLDVAMVCEQARTMIAADDEILADSSPEELVAFAERMLLTRLDDDAVRVSEASFGTVSAMPLPDVRTCVSESRAVVVFVATGDASQATCAEGWQ